MSFQIFAQEPGFGKTMLACAKVKALFTEDEYKDGYALFVVPTPVVDQWREEISKNDLYLKYELVGKKGERENFLENTGFLVQCVYLTTPGTLVNDIESGLYTRKPSIVVYDEVHLISACSSSSKNEFGRFGTLDVNNMCRVLAAFNKEINYKIGLTGTPYQNNMADLFSTYAFMEKAEWLADLPPMYDKSLWDTDERFKQVRENFADGKTYLFGGTEPKKSFGMKEIFVPIRLSDKMSADVKVLQDNNFDLQKISQFLLCPKTYKNDSEFNDLGIDTKNDSSGKILFAERIIKEIPYDEKIVVFSFYTDVLEQLKNKLEAHGISKDSIVILKGSDSIKRIEGFTAGSARILLTTLEKCGYGVSLQSANHSVILDFWWNPAVMEQAIHRIIRYNQTRDVHIYAPIYIEYENGGIVKMNDVDKKHIVDAVFRKVKENRGFIKEIICERGDKNCEEDEYARELEQYAMQDFPFEAFPRILDMERLFELHNEDLSNWLTEILDLRKSLPSRNEFLFCEGDEVMFSESGVDCFKSKYVPAEEPSGIGNQNEKESKLRLRYEARAENDCQYESNKALSGNNICDDGLRLFLEASGLLEWLGELNGSMDSIGSIHTLLEKGEEEIICGWCNADKDEMEFEIRDWLNRYIDCCRSNVDAKNRSDPAANYADICNWIFREMSAQKGQPETDPVRFRYDTILDVQQSSPLFRACVVLFEANGLEQCLSKSIAACISLQQADKTLAFYRAAFDWFLGKLQEADRLGVVEALRQVHKNSCRMLGYLDAAKRFRRDKKDKVFNDILSLAYLAKSTCGSNYDLLFIKQNWFDKDLTI